MSKIIYDVYQNKNEDSSAFGKYYGRIVHTETLNTRKLAKHIAEHGSVYTQDVVEGVLRPASWRCCWSPRRSSWRDWAPST